MARRRTFIGLLTVATMMAALGGCRLKDQPAPALVGPSELGLSVSLSALPDAVTRDGGSQSVIIVQARNENAQPVSNLTVRMALQCLDISDPKNPVRQYTDFGSLSATTVVTGGDGKASLVYTAPSADSPLNQFCSTDSIWVIGTPVGTNYANDMSREVEIRLVSSGVIVPPGTLLPAFTYTPSTPKEGQTVKFDASTSTPASAIVSYAWTFGDGGSATGVTASHTFMRADPFAVTLTVTDALGRAVSTTQYIDVGVGDAPSADFVFSPTAPRINDTIYFNASASQPAPGRVIGSYTWDFGDGSTGSGVTASHAYSAAGTYVVTLTVSDDLGNRDTKSSNVAVGSPNPTASFTFSPSTGVHGADTINFSASGSSAASGHTITTYTWDFGDGTSSSGASATVGHIFATAGTFTVTLTVTDDQGLTAVQTKTITIS